MRFPSVSGNSQTAFQHRVAGSGLLSFFPLQQHKDTKRIDPTRYGFPSFFTSGVQILGKIVRHAKMRTRIDFCDEVFPFHLRRSFYLPLVELQSATRCETSENRSAAPTAVAGLTHRRGESWWNCTRGGDGERLPAANLGSRGWRAAAARRPD